MRLQHISSSSSSSSTTTTTTTSYSMLRAGARACTQHCCVQARAPARSTVACRRARLHAALLRAGARACRQHCCMQARAPARSTVAATPTTTTATTIHLLNVACCSRIFRGPAFAQEFAEVAGAGAGVPSRGRIACSREAGATACSREAGATACSREAGATACSREAGASLTVHSSRYS